jgi:threonine/homoserine/homoserine lactone efflux protein
MQSIPLIFSSAFVIGLSGAMMPGPVLVATINRSARMGFKAGPLIVLGHAIIEGSLVVAIFMGLGAALAEPVVKNPIMLGGGVMLTFLGAMILRDVWRKWGSLWESMRGEAENPAAREQESPLKPVAEGILLSASNPYWGVWWATIGLTYIGVAGGIGSAGIAAFFSGHILSDLAWYSLVSAGIAVGTRYMNEVIYRSVLFTCSLFLIGLGVFFVLQGASALVTLV